MARRAQMEKIQLPDILRDASLQGLPQEFWPRCVALEALQQEVAKQKKRGIAHPFVCSDLRKWCPEWALQGGEKPDEEAPESALSREVSRLAKGLAQARHPCSCTKRGSAHRTFGQAMHIPESSKKKPLLTICQWHMAWTRLGAPRHQPARRAAISGTEVRDRRGGHRSVNAGTGVRPPRKRHACLGPGTPAQAHRYACSRRCLARRRPPIGAVYSSAFTMTRRAGRRGPRK